MILIGGLEGVQIHPLDAEPMGRIQENTNYTSDLLRSIFNDSIFCVGNKKTGVVQHGSMTKQTMNDDEAIHFFGITKEEIVLARSFTA